jgi:hypothetical protein
VASEAAALGVFQVNMPEGAGHWSDQMWRIRGLEPRPGLPGSDLAVATVHPEDRDVVRGLRETAAPIGREDVGDRPGLVFATD